MDRKIRIMIAVVGADGEGPYKPIARALRDAGCEVIYVGENSAAAWIAASALQEDVDALLVFPSATDHEADLAPVRKALVDAEMADVPVLNGLDFTRLPADRIPHALHEFLAPVRARLAAELGVASGS